MPLGSKTPDAAAPTLAWLVSGDEPHGVRRAIESLSLGLRGRGWRTPMLCLGEGDFADDCERRGVPVVRLGVGRPGDLAGGPLAKVRGFARLLTYQRRAARAVADAARDVNASAVQVLWPQLVGTAAEAARRSGAALIWEMPNTVGGRYPLGLNRRVLYRQLRRPGRGKTLVLANSRHTAASLSPRPGDCPVPLHVMHLGVDEHRFVPDRPDAVPRSSLDIPDDAVVLAVVARLEDQKGGDRLLRAALSLDAKAHVLFLGGPADGDFAGELRSIAAAAGASDRLHLLGGVADPERYYGLIDVAVNARVDAEPFGLSVVEAMMMARPVLAHGLGGPAETVLDGQTGWLYDDPSVAGVTAALRRALNDRPRWPEMGVAARRHALEHFTLDRQVQTYLSHVGPLLGLPAPALRY